MAFDPWHFTQNTTTGDNITGLLTSLAQNDPVNQVVNNAGDIASLIQQQSEQIWAREDSAYQRMVEDMKKAGLNPWTGISSGGSPTSATNPSLDSLSGLLSILNTNIANHNSYIQAGSAGMNAMYKTGSLISHLLDSIGKFLGYSL